MGSDDCSKRAFTVFTGIHNQLKSCQSDWGKEILFVAKFDGSFDFWSGWVRHSNQEWKIKWCTGNPRVAVLPVQLVVLGCDSIQNSKYARIALNLGFFLTHAGGSHWETWSLAKTWCHLSVQPAIEISHLLVLCSNTVYVFIYYIITC